MAVILINMKLLKEKSPYEGAFTRLLWTLSEKILN